MNTKPAVSTKASTSESNVESSHGTTFLEVIDTSRFSHEVGPTPQPIHVADLERTDWLTSANRTRRDGHASASGGKYHGVG